jgi:hypothetical protein
MGEAMNLGSQVERVTTPICLAKGNKQYFLSNKQMAGQTIEYCLK